MLLSRDRDDLETRFHLPICPGSPPLLNSLDSLLTFRNDRVPSGSNEIALKLPFDGASLNLNRKRIVESLACKCVTRLGVSEN